MSKVEIKIPDDRWFRGEWQFKPQDKQLCVVIPKDRNIPVLICQYREEKVVSIDIFLYSSGTKLYSEWAEVDRWKPLGLPEDVNERVLAEIEKWFEEEE